MKIWDTLFELIQIEVQCSKNYFKYFLPQKAGAFGKNIEKKPQKPRPKLKKEVYSAIVSFLEKYIRTTTQTFWNINESHWLHTLQIFTVWKPRVEIRHTLMEISLNLGFYRFLLQRHVDQFNFIFFKEYFYTQPVT